MKQYYYYFGTNEDNQHMFLYASTSEELDKKIIYLYRGKNEQDEIDDKFIINSDIVLNHNDVLNRMISTNHGFYEIDIEQLKHISGMEYSLGENDVDPPIFRVFSDESSDGGNNEGSGGESGGGAGSSNYNNQQGGINSNPNLQTYVVNNPKTNIEFRVFDVGHGNYSAIVDKTTDDPLVLIDCNKTLKNINSTLDQTIFILTHWHYDHAKLIWNNDKKLVDYFKHLVLPYSPTLIKGNSQYAVKSIAKVINRFNSKGISTQILNYPKSSIAYYTVYLGKTVLNIFCNGKSSNPNESGLMVGITNPDIREINAIAAIKDYSILAPGDASANHFNHLTYEYIIYPHHGCHLSNHTSINPTIENILSRKGSTFSKRLLTINAVNQFAALKAANIDTYCSSYLNTKIGTCKHDCLSGIDCGIRLSFRNGYRRISL